MSNTKHKACAMRNMAHEAKKRLAQNDYAKCSGAMAPPKDVTPSQRTVFLKLRQLIDKGESVINPIQQLADQDKLQSLSHEERQRYILQLSADYVSMKRAIDERMSKVN